MNKMYVGNLAFSTTEDDLREHLSGHGDVKSVKIITDRDTGNSKGFGFVEMENVQSVIDALNGSNLDGRAIKLDVATEKPTRA